MGSFSYLFVRSQDVEAIRRVVTAGDLRMRVEVVRSPTSEWLLLDRGPFDLENVTDIALRFSRVLEATTVAILGHSATDYFLAATFDKGVSVRTVERGQDGWKCTGAPLSWEREVFSGNAVPGDEELSESSSADQEAARTRTLVDGAMVPQIDEHGYIEHLGGGPLLRSTPAPTRTPVGRRRWWLWG